MSNYNKNERPASTKQADGNRNVIKCCWTNYLQLIVYSIGVLYLFSIVAPDLFDYIRALTYGYDYPRAENLVFATVFVSLFNIPIIYFIIRSIFVDMKGKLEYTDTALHYEGYNFDFFPRKSIIDLSFSEIAHIHIYREKIAKTHRDIMSVRKTDGTSMKLNICYFNIDNITKLMYQHILKAAHTSSVLDAQKYQITIHNHKGFILGYLNLDIYVNDEMSNTRESTHTVDVKTGDILAIKNYSNTHIYRLDDPTLTHYHVDDSMNTFKIFIGKD